MTLRSSKMKFFRVFRKFIKTFEPNKKVLDAASNSFTNARFFTKMNYTGVDLDKDALKLGKKRYPGNNFKAVHSNILKMPFQKGSFDYVISTHTFSHLADNDDVLKAIRNLVEVTKKGGKLFFNINFKIESPVEKEIDSLTFPVFETVRKVKYRRFLTDKWEALVVRKKPASGLRLWLLYPLSKIISYIDFFGDNTHTIYLCDKKKPRID